MKNEIFHTSCNEVLRNICACGSKFAGIGKGMVLGMKKKSFFLFCMCFVLLLAGCGKKEEIGPYSIIYLNKEKTGVMHVSYQPVATETQDMIAEFLKMLSSDTDNVEYRKPIPNDVEVVNYSLDGALLTIYFDADYEKMEEVEEVLCRAAVVRTLTQIPGIDCVSFYTGETPLADAKGNLVGSMTADSFVENPGEQINSIQNTDLTLYFANEAGDALIQETRKVHYSSNISLEKLIIEELIDGPKTEGLRSAIPAGTKLMNISVVDGVCYVSLDETFRNQDYSVSESVVIYSIVNSLSELKTISKVQISVNGDTSGVYRDTFSLSDMYTRNLDCVTTLTTENETDVVEGTETTETGTEAK